ncbi:branched-chain amino acid transport system II carrier protein [Alloscardovia theropitheci]|uniref:Branched-chain amino acid transport system II carrier protein n=1 Tax=Alloscardovia theropitheci TaxID=2496842 RepID=A0A4R0QRA8_9BIFI|nr:branched-chain amino acid transport system II carrier protein [Alloscardovia theropitheci]
MKKLTSKQTIIVASMLFGLFFGAGNLIFPISMGQKAGEHLWQAIIGFCITGVGLPLLGIAAYAISEKKSLFELGSLVSKGFAYFFTVALYLTIGPLFAIPRTATVPFQVGVAPLIPSSYRTLSLAIFSLVFFAVVLFFSLRPNRILDWVGKILNPLFLSVLAILVITALVKPMGSVSAIRPSGQYISQPFFTGFLEGYNTMDALAALAFGIVLIDVIHSLGVKDSRDTAFVTMKSGVLAVICMAAIYGVLTFIGAQSGNILGVSADGGIALFAIAEQYYGVAGGILLGIIISLACVKTAIGLITSISTTFTELFPRVCTYKRCAVFFTFISFVIANAGLDAIITFSVPILLFLYPITIVLTVLAVTGRVFSYKRSIFVGAMVLTMIVAGITLLSTLTDLIPGLGGIHQVLLFVNNAFPAANIGMGWVIPAVIGAIIGLCIPARASINA